MTAAEWTPTSRHHFEPDPQIPRDHLGRRWCLTCGVVEGSARHWPARDPAEARRYGERDDQDDDDD